MSIVFARYLHDIMFMYIVLNFLSFMFTGMLLCIHTLHFIYSL